MEEKDTKIVVMELNEIKGCFEGILQAHQNEIISLLREDNNAKQARIIEELKEKKALLEQELFVSERETQEIREQKEEYRKKYTDLMEESEKKEHLMSADKETIRLLKIELEELEKKNIELQKENARVVSDKETIIASMKERIGVYENRYWEIEDILALYQGLSEDLQIRLKNILGSGSIYEILSGTREWNNIEGMWNFTKRRIVEEENADVNSLVKLSRFMFKAYLNHENARGYIMISPKKGEKYDSDKHSIMGTKTDGIIEELLLDGIYDNVAKKVIFKAVVTVI